MKKTDLLLIPVFVVLAVTTVWTLTEWEKEGVEEYEASAQVAENVRALGPNETNCNEVNTKLLALSLEEFDGAALIKQAWEEKHEVLGC